MSKLTYLAARVKNLNTQKMKERLEQVHERSGRPKPIILADMVWCGLRYQAGYIDYTIFGMENLTGKQRKTLLTRGKNNEYVRALNRREDWHYFDSKIEFLNLFKTEAKREFLDLTAASTDDFALFILRHPIFFAKDNTGLCGAGISRIVTDKSTDAEKLRKELLQKKATTIEEPIIQHEALAKLYGGSINTVRMMTLRDDSGIPHIVFTCLRVGKGGGFVDNLNAGGMLAPIKKETGLIEEPAIDKQCHVFDVHPDTNVAFRGFQIPFWEECCDLVLTAAKRVEGIRYVGWDVALTPDGPILVEGNHFPGHDVTLLSTQTRDTVGVFPEFDRVVPYQSLKTRTKK